MKGMQSIILFLLLALLVFIIIAVFITMRSDATSESFNTINDILIESTG